MIKPSNYLPDPRLKNFIAAYGILEIPEVVDETYFSPPLAMSGFIIQKRNFEGKVIAKICEKVLSIIRWPPDRAIDAALAVRQEINNTCGR